MTEKEAEAPKGDGVFCLACGKRYCLDMVEDRSLLLWPRQVDVLRALARPDMHRLKDIAFALGLTHGSVKIYIALIHKKLGWKGGGTSRDLLLWAIAHREQLGIELPTPDQFARPKVRPKAA